MSTTKARPRPPYRLTTEVVREHPLQAQIATMLRLELCREGHVSPDGVCWFSIDMAHYAGVPGTRVARGICAGVPDVIVLYQGRARWIEIKTDAGVLSDNQRAMCAALTASGCTYAVARNAMEVLELLDWWRVPRARRVRLVETKKDPAQNAGPESLVWGGNVK